MKKGCLWLLKVLTASVAAFGVISVFCFFYYNTPVHYTSQTNATDYYWEKDTVSFRGSEGFARTETDKNGYVNTYPKTQDEIDILVMGSSHTEGFNVAKNENFVYCLNEMLADNGHDMYAYNIGVSGHTIERCFRNLETAMDEFAPSKYVVIETVSVAPSLEVLKQLEEGTLPYLSSYDSGLIHDLQKSDFFRLMYSQFSNAIKNSPPMPFLKTPSADALQTNVSENSKDDAALYEQYLESMLKNGSDIAKEHGCALIILYNAEIEFDYNGEILAVSDTQKEEKERFSALCQKYDIAFVDMYAPFAEMYEESKHLPRGFSNTQVGEGHINKYGHAEIAKVLYNHMAKGIEK